jgi:hypothetical protein
VVGEGRVEIEVKNRKHYYNSFRLMIHMDAIIIKCNSELPFLSRQGYPLALIVVLSDWSPGEILIGGERGILELMIGGNIGHLV